MKALRALFDPHESIGLYILGTAALTVAIQIVYDISKEPFGLVGAISLAAFLFSVVIGVIVVQNILQRRRASKFEIEISNVPKHKALILLISPGNTDLPNFAICHHLPDVKHCWLITTAKSLETAEALEKSWKELYPYLKVYWGDEYNVRVEEAQDTWQLVQKIYDRGLADFGLLETDILADITGASKPMTTGMALACFGTRRPIQYIKTARDETGNPIPDAPRIPILITTPPASRQEPAHNE